VRTYRMGVLQGDGIGPEIVGATRRVVEAAVDACGGVELEWVELPMGWEAIRTTGNAMPEGTVEQLAGCHGWIMGPHDSASYPEGLKRLLNPSGRLRIHFDLYANVRPARTFPGVKGLASDTDLVVVRENTEGFYPDRNMAQGLGEMMPVEGVVLSVGVFTRRAAERIARVAFQLAQGRRKHVSIVHKANVIRMGTGLFLQTCREVAGEYPDVRVDDYHIDAMAAHLVRRSRDFDVIVTTNMFGDILSDLASELVGSLGLAGSLNAGDDHAMAQAAHGSAPDIAGQGIANPVGLMHSAVMLLEWMGEKYEDGHLKDLSRMIECAVAAVLSTGPRTRDLGGQAGTDTFTQGVIGRLGEAGERDGVSKC
jgi:3-isopropylmalate dehydrogenase